MYKITKRINKQILVIRQFNQIIQGSLQEIVFFFKHESKLSKILTSEKT